MKRLLIIFASIIAFTLTSCHYHNINGDLDGNWHFLSIEQADGTIIEPDEVYLGIQMHTFNIQQLGGRKAGNFYYDKAAKTLALEFPYEYDLSSIGLPNSPCTVKFHITHLTKQRLVMRLDSSDAIYTFRKF